METDKNLAVPTIHLNGTGYRDLHREYMDAYAAVTQAIEKMREITVHGRDYYVQTPDGYPVARQQHIDRLQKLDDVQRELLIIIVRIDDQKR